MSRAGWRVRIATLAFVSAAPLLLLGCGDSEGNRGGAQGTTAATEAATLVTTARVPPLAATAPVTTADLCPGNIPWDAAASHIRQEAIVEGPVAGTKFATSSRGQPTFLDVGRPYPDPGFIVVIWIENRSKFPTPPEQLYANKTICVTGVIQLYQGSPEIVVASPDQIRAI